MTFSPTLWGAGAAIALALLAGAYLQGDRHGAQRIQSRWDAANLQAIDDAMRNRKDADNSIPELTETERNEDRARSPVGKPCRVFDAHDRDC